MAEVEVCQIVEVRRQVGFLSEPAFWEAHQITSQGEVTIARSQFKIPGLFKSLAGGEMACAEERRAAHSKVIAQLVGQGWEPAGTDSEGLISAMKRYKS